MSADRTATPPASDAFAGVETGSPARTGDRYARSGGGRRSDDGDSPFDNWLIGMVIAAVVAGSLWMHSGMKLRSSPKTSPERRHEIDT